MSESLEARVTAALAAIHNPRLENDILSAGMVRDLTVTAAGDVSFTFLLGPNDPPTLVRQARSAVQGVEVVFHQAALASVKQGKHQVLHNALMEFGGKLDRDKIDAGLFRAP